jgi:solute carrier family 25 citrate transporter 1
MHNLKNL